MEILVESFPFVFGVLLGLTSHRLGGVRDRWLLSALGAVLLGSFATLATGEWRVSVAYFALDIALVASVCVATDWLLTKLRSRLPLKH